MAKVSWEISGDYFETCSCTYFCPCILTNLSGRPTRGYCTFAMLYHIERGHHGNLPLDGLNFALVGQTPEEMAKGNWSLGVIIDERARPDQQQALATIASGQGGGPLAALAPLITKFLGVQVKPIQFKKNGMRWSVAVPGVLDQGIEGVASLTVPGEPLYIDNTIHPAHPRMALARATRSHLDAFGLQWDDTSGQNSGVFTSFTWRSSE